MKKLILPACALLIAFSSCNNQQSTTQSDVSVPVRVTEVAKKTIRNTLTVNGTVSPTGTSEVKTEAEGQYRLQRNPRTGAAYKMGDRVNKDEVIVKIENPEYVLSIRPDAKELDWENARSEYEKQKSLYDKGGVTLNELKKSEISFLNARYDNENAQMQMSKLSIKSPFDGVIVDLPYFTPGIKVASGTLALKVMDYSKLKLNVEFPEKYITTVFNGQEAFVTNYNMKDDTLIAHIDELSPAINESSRTFKGVLMVNNPELKMRPGMFVKSDIVIEKKDSALVVPRDVIRKGRRGEVVFVIENNAAIERPIKTGIGNDTEIEIIDGLKTGEKLVVEGYEMLSNRTKVKVQN
jgi:membrane fusion protein, multidrug efflux system